MALTRILDKLVQVGPGYLDQTLRTYVTENRDFTLYQSNNKTYAVYTYYSSGNFILEEDKTADILIVGGGGGGTIGNLSGGSGAGDVIEVQNATLTADLYKVEIGAGGAGASISNPADADTANPYTGAVATAALGSEGNDTIFSTSIDTNQIIALGGGVGGFRSTDTLATVGGSGGGAGGGDIDQNTGAPNSGTAGYSLGANNTSDATVTATYYGGNVFSYTNEGGDSDAVTNAALYANGGIYQDMNTYQAGGGGGAGEKGEAGQGKKGGKGGDGVTLSWVNEVFQHVYRVNNDVYWGAGGGGAASKDIEPGNGGKGGGGGGASVRQSLDTSTDAETYWEGYGGKYGINLGWDSNKLVGGAGAVNTGSGAGGSSRLLNTDNAFLPITQGPNGGSGFVMVRVHLDDNFSAYAGSMLA